MKQEVTSLDDKIESYTERLSDSLDTLDELKTYSEAEKKEQKKLLAETLTTAFLYGREINPNAGILCFEIKLPKKQDEKKPYIFLNSNYQDYMVEMGDSPSGNATRVMNFINGFEEFREKIAQARLDAITRRAIIAEKLKKPDLTNKNKLIEKQIELNNIRNLIECDIRDEQ